MIIGIGNDVQQVIFCFLPGGHQHEGTKGMGHWIHGQILFYRPCIQCLWNDNFYMG